MAYTVKYNGYDVICNSVEDVKALLNDNGVRVDTPVAPRVAAPVSNHPSGVTALIGKLHPDQRELVRVVSDGGVIPRERVMQILGVTDARNFAGRLIGITKSAAGSGIPSPIEKVEQRMNGNGPRTYNYKIKDNVRAEVKAALSK
jgi:hypothetical protein